MQDTRTTLLRLADGSADKAIRRGADALAAHIEGQQLDQPGRAAGCAAADQVPFYCAVPLQFGEETTLAEMRLWSWDDDARETDDLPADTPWLRATVRVATTRLGRVQAELAGTLAGNLTCRLGAEKPATARLLHRHAGTLAASLAALAGWRGSDVQCHVRADWTPLWHGGDTTDGAAPLRGLAGMSKPPDEPKSAIALRYARVRRHRALRRRQGSRAPSPRRFCGWPANMTSPCVRTRRWPARWPRWTSA